RARSSPDGGRLRASTLHSHHPPRQRPSYLVGHPAAGADPPATPHGRRPGVSESQAWFSSFDDNGISIKRLVPCPGSDSMVNRPPNNSARSRIPYSPKCPSLLLT